MTVLMKEQDDVMAEAGRGPQDPRILHDWGV
jgi:hypothetical protein